MSREFRAVWIATVDNIDWPSKGNHNPERQRQELTTLLDLAAKLKFNTVLLQVRPAADALYRSSLEPWSEYLTGRQGTGPEPPYDPLEFAVTEAHRRGLQIQAWINPYRAKHPSAKGALASSHVAVTNPNEVRKYGDLLWMDPGSPFVRKRTVQVVEDIVRRYDIDGVHLDDYFYPYPEGGKDFPDDATYRKFGRSLDKSDWRRRNVNELIKELYTGIHNIKPTVQFGISPFGIYRSGIPEGIKAGVDQYRDMGSDPVEWLRNGWCDYLSPQLYWPINQRAQSFSTLLSWWESQNIHGRHIWPGLYTSRVLTPSSSFPPSEIIRQIEVDRQLVAGDPGQVHFSMKALSTNAGNIDSLLAKAYQLPALPPESSWLPKIRPLTPELNVESDGTATWSQPGAEQPFWIVLWARYGRDWSETILPGDLKAYSFPRRIGTSQGSLNTVAIAAVGRTGTMSEPLAEAVQGRNSGG